jgi:glycosyltransferase involved in cell wall biosynthesis
VDAIWSDTLGRRIRHGNLHLLLELPRTYARAAAEAMRRATYDVVHVSQPHGFRAARVAHAMTPGCVFIHRSHGLELHVEEVLRPWRARLGADGRSPFRRLASMGLTRLIARHSHAIAHEADGHIVSSSMDAEFLRSRMGVPPERIAVVPQAPPQEYQDIPPEPMSDERLKRILHVAQFAFVKAPMITAEAIGLLAQRRPDAEFTWVCDRADHASVRALLDGDALRRTEILPWMPPGELRRVYDRCGIFLFPSFFEGFGRTFLEAMSRGLCVVASSCGGMRDVIEHGRDGMLVPTGDAEALAATACELMDNRSQAATMSATAASSAGKYTWERVARETVGFFERRLGQRRVGTG